MSAIMGELTRAAVNKPPSLWSGVICCVLRERDSERVRMICKQPPIRLSPSGSLLEEQEEQEERRRGSGPCSPGCWERTGAELSIRERKKKSAGWEGKKERKKDREREREEGAM